MKKIKIEKWVFFIDDNLIAFILEMGKNKTEKIGYIFGERIKGTREVIIYSWTFPHHNDKSTTSFSATSYVHKKIAKKLLKENEKLFSIGFYHTHPNWFNSKPSWTDLNEFTRTSRTKEISLFIIATSYEISLYFYMNGRCKKKITF